MTPVLPDPEVLCAGLVRDIDNQRVLGCQIRKNKVNAAMDVIDAMMSTNQGPCSVETKYCGTAKQTPVTRIAGQIWIIPRKPANAQINQNGMITEKKGSWWPICFES